MSKLVWPQSEDPIQIPFGYGALALGYCKSKEGRVALMLGILDPPGKAGEVDDRETTVRYVISFRNKDSLDLLQSIHDRLLELYEKGTINGKTEGEIDG